MFDQIRSVKFKREYRLMEKRRKNMAKLDEVMWRIVSGQPLLPHHKDHPLAGNWRGCRECHIEPDWILIYEIDAARNEVKFNRTGSHSDLFT